MIKEEIHIPAGKQGRMTAKKPDERYQDFLTLLKTCKFSLFTINNYKVSASFKLYLRFMGLIVCLFESGEGLSVIKAKFQDRSWLDNIRRRDVTESRGAFDMKLVVSGTITFSFLCVNGALR